MLVAEHVTHPPQSQVVPLPRDTEGGFELLAPGCKTSHSQPTVQYQPATSLVVHIRVNRKCSHSGTEFTFKERKWSVWCPTPMLPVTQTPFCKLSKEKVKTTKSFRNLVWKITYARKTNTRYQLSVCRCSLLSAVWTYSIN